MPFEKKVFGWAASHAAPLSSLLGSRWIDGPSMPLWVDQTSGVRRDKIRTIRRMSHYFKLEFPLCFSAEGSRMWTGIVVQRHNTFRQQSSAFASNCRLQPVSKHLTVPRTVYCCATLLIMFQYWALWFPKHCKLQFSCGWLGFELFLVGVLWMWPIP